MGGTPSHDSSGDGFSVQIKCNHTNGEKYAVTVKRDSIIVSSYENDAIETWADAYAGDILAEFLFFSEPRPEMNRKLVISGVTFLVLAALVGTEYLSTSILTDGSFVLASSGQTDNGSYASRVMAADASELTRSLMGGESLVSDLSVKSSGPVLVSDYASGKSALTPDSLACVFIRHVQGQEEESGLYSMGILNKGSYAASRVVGPGLTHGLDVNGSGMMSFGSQKIGNSSLRSSEFVSGNMTIRDYVKYGGKL
jgi:hypothetical protein